MSSPETYIAFAAIMLVIALLAVAIDWFGKPLRHRKFVPKTYRFPDERTPRRAPQRVTPWSDAALVLPVSEGTLEPAQPPVPAAFQGQPPMPVLAPPGMDHRPLEEVTSSSPYPDEPAATSPYPDEPAATSPYPDEPATDDRGDAHAGSAPADGAVVEDPGEDAAASVSVFADVEPAAPEADGTASDETSDDTDDTVDAGDAADAGTDDPRPTGADGRTIGWHPGDYVFNLTGEGREPSPSTIRTRFWKNVGATAGASIFGESNMERLLRGKPPQRRNPRTRKMESMHLPTVGYHDNDGELPVPAWPTSEPDPFADR